MAIVAFLLLLALTASVAAAAAGHRYTGQFSGPGAGAGDLSSPVGIAINTTSGDVYVVDSGNNRVERFSAAGDYLGEFDLSSADGGGSLSGGIAVDQSTGDVYVTATRGDTSANVVDRFSATGAFEIQIDGSTTPAASFGFVGGVAVDPVDGTVYVSDSANNVVNAFDDAGGYLAQFGGTGGSGEGELSWPAALAVDSSHAVYVIDGFGVRVQKFTAHGASFVSVVDANSPQALAVDPSNDHLLVGGFDPSFAYQVVDYDSSGTRVYAFGAGRLGFSLGLAATASSKVYVADFTPNAILTFGPFTAPMVSTGAATDVTAEGATLNGTVDPEGVATTYRFEYGIDTSYGSSTPQSDPPDSGDGDVPASASLSGLAPNTTYHYRLVASNDDGSNVGEDQTFTTATLAPEVDTGAATGVTFEAAELHGTVDPNNSQTTYHFEYGTDTSYGSSTADADAGAGSNPAPVSAAIAGLEPATTYHYKLVADNGTGGAISGPDRTFTTADPPPGATTGSVSGVTAGSATLHGTADTHGLPGTFRFSVVQTDGTHSDATATAAVPAGSGEVGVTATVDGLPAGSSYEVRLGVTTSGGTRYGAKQSFSTLPTSSYVPAPPPARGGSKYGCDKPRLDAFRSKARPGRSITLTGADLGVAGTLTFGGKEADVRSHTSTAVTATVPGGLAGTVSVRLDCSKESNTIRVAVVKAPTNSFVVRPVVAGGVARLKVTVPGPGRIVVRGRWLRTKRVVATKRGGKTLRLRLTRAGRRALRAEGDGALTLSPTIRFTPTGGTSRTTERTLTLKRKSSR